MAWHADCMRGCWLHAWLLIACVGFLLHGISSHSWNQQPLMESACLILIA